MATLILPNSIDAFTAADAAEVDQNYRYIRDFVNNNVVHRDGSKSMTGPLILIAGDPADDAHAARKSYVDALLPVGTILPFGGINAPSERWLICNGGSYATTGQYKPLFDVLLYHYGGSGGTFMIPDLRGRLPIGVNEGGLTRFNAIGREGGSWLVPVPSHTHAIDHDHPSFDSGNQSASHTHEHVHTHSIAHDHATATTTEQGNHTHDGYVTPNSGGGGTLSPLSIKGASSTPVGQITDTAGLHWHYVDIKGFTGTSGEPNEATTGNNSVTHNHKVDIPKFTGPSGAYEKEVQNDDNPVSKSTTELIPPYTTVNYIIKAN